MKEIKGPPVEEDQEWLIVDEALLILAKDSRNRYLFESIARQIIDRDITQLEKMIKARKERIMKFQKLQTDYIKS